MPAYAIAHIREIDLNEDILVYLRKIDASLEPYDGRFVVHGVVPEVVEEPFPGAIVIIEFPDGGRAREWYESDAYAEILPLRTENSDSSAILVEGTPPGYRAEMFAEKLIEQGVLPDDRAQG
jgi:uncharacterized protein (DUF1330 family)